MKTGSEELRRRLLIVGAVAMSCAAGQIPSAAATVHVDPNGPAGQQYALPLDSARGQASGTPDAGVPGANAKAPLFGQGIRPSGSPARWRHGAKPNRQGRGNSGTRPVNVRDAGIAAASGGDSTTLWVAAVIAAIVLLGSAAGLIVRRPAAEPQG
jgi:hypothetical protein